MTELWIGIAAQIPVVVAFMLFMIRWQKSQHEANERNHKLWQDWLNRTATENQEERAEWREWLRTRDERMIRAMTKLEQQIVALSNIVLAFVATNSESGPVNRVMETLTKLNQKENE